MRILQLIDSLEAGGAERMAVNYANVLADEIPFSGLVATRKEGSLVRQLDEKVEYLFLNRKHSFDIAALFRLRKFVKLHKVTLIHAHSSSFFIGVLLRLIYPEIQLIWHNHYGNIEFSSRKRLLSLKILAPFFCGVIAVNQKLKLWSEQKNNFKNTIYLPNFLTEEKKKSAQTVLKGIEGKRIVSLANLREDKDHLLLLQVAKKMKESYPDWTFHLVGKDFCDNYADRIKKKIEEYNLENSVFIYGSKQDISNILRQSTIGILTSKSEGLPVALLEYGWQQKPVVVTAVGEIPLVIQNGKNGFLVPSQDIESFYTYLVELMINNQLQQDFGSKLYQTVTESFSAREVIKKYLNWLENSLE